MPIVTNHAKRRMRERTGITSGKAISMSRRILDVGITHAEAKGELKKLMDGIYLAKLSANNMRYYAGDLYLFNGGIMITVFTVSDDINKNLGDNVETEAYERYVKFMNRNKRPGTQGKVTKTQLLDEVNQWAANYYRNPVRIFVAVDILLNSYREIRIEYISDRARADFMDFTAVMKYVSRKYNKKCYLVHKRDRNRRYLTVDEYRR